MFKTELLEFDIETPLLSPILSKTEFAIKFARSRFGSGLYLFRGVCARSLSLCLSLGLSADRTPFLSDFVCLLRGMPGIRWMVF